MGIFMELPYAQYYFRKFKTLVQYLDIVNPVIFKLSLGLVSKMSIIWPQLLTKYITYKISLSSFDIPWHGPKLIQYFQETDFSLCSLL